MTEINYEGYAASSTLLKGFIQEETEAETKIDTDKLASSVFQHSYACFGLGVLAITAPTSVTGESFLNESEQLNTEFFQVETSHIANRYDLSTIFNNRLEPVRGDIKLHEIFQFSNEEELKAYFVSNSDIAEWLYEFGDELSKNKGISSHSVELYKDLEERWEKVFVTLKHHSENFDDAYELESQLYGEFIEPNIVNLAGRVVLAVI